MRRPRGFTIVEMMVYVLLAGIVMAAVYQLLIGQSRSYGKQRELMDVHETLRGVAALLAWEIRQISSAGGDLYATGANSITLRSIQGGGVVCGLHTTLARVGLGRTWGDFDDTAGDSVLVYSADTDSWLTGPIDNILPDPAPAGVGYCDWGGGASIVPDLVLDMTVSTDMSASFFAFCKSLTGVQRGNCMSSPDWPTYCAGLPGAQKTACDAALAAAQAAVGPLQVGVPFRAFRRIEYGLYEEGGRWWLGRKVGDAASYEKLTGPLRSAAGGGLVFTYYDAAGAVTAVPGLVAAVEFIIRAESYRLPGSGSTAFQQDSLAIRVALRG